MEESRRVTLIVDPSAFCPLEEFRRLMDETMAYIKSSPPAAGFDEALVPGELEFRTLRHRQEIGIAVDPTSMESMREHGARLGVDVDCCLGSEGET
jgi:LDH2 family malate/lactate/ureidoglycolate dehydrogenase